MQQSVLALLAFSGIALAMSAAGLVLLATGLLLARAEMARARGFDKISVSANLCFALPLAVFGAEHLAGPKLLIGLVPPYMPWRVFWVYFVGCALIAASLSIVTRIQVRWSGLLLGVMMFLFVAMLYFPSAIFEGDRISWTVTFREMAFGGAGWILAGRAWAESHGHGKSFIAVGRVLIGLAAIFLGVQHFLRLQVLPVVPLRRLMPAWVPVPSFINYLTGQALTVAGLCFLLGWKTRPVAQYLGAWILLLVVAIYGPVMIAALADPNAAAQIEGLNYFADTLMFAGTVLSLASGPNCLQAERA